MVIIPISGKARHGKDTFATFLKIELEKEGKRVLITHFGDYVKFIAKNIYGWNGEKDEKGRKLLQYIGKTFRNYKNSFFVDIIKDLINVVYKDFDYILIPDVRFPNELDTMKNFEGKSISVVSVFIKRDFIPKEELLTEEAQKDVSETLMDDMKFDLYFEFKGNDLEEVKYICNLQKDFFIKYIE